MKTDTPYWRTTKALFALPLVVAAAILLAYDAELYAVAVVHIFALPAIAYPAVYRNSPWRSGPTGKALFNKARSMALLFAVSIIGYWWPFPGYAYIYGLVVTYVGCAISYQFYVMLRLKLAAQKHPAYQGKHTSEGATS